MFIIIINILLGILFSFLVKFITDKHNTIIVNGSQVHKVKNNIYKYNDKCYILEDSSSKENNKDIKPLNKFV